MSVSLKKRDSLRRYVELVSLLRRLAQRVDVLSANLSANGSLTPRLTLSPSIHSMCCALQRKGREVDATCERLHALDIEGRTALRRATEGILADSGGKRRADAKKLLKFAGENFAQTLVESDRQRLRLRALLQERDTLAARLIEEIIEPAIQAQEDDCG